MANCKTGKNGKFVSIVWTDAMINRLRRDFPTMLNSDVALELGVSMSTMHRKARELGLRKCNEFNDINAYAIRRRSSIAQRCKPNSGWFKKGVHACPEKEFVKGHPPLTGEKETARLRKMSETRRRLIDSERVRMKYGLPRQTRIKLK